MQIVISSHSDLWRPFANCGYISEVYNYKLKVVKSNGYCLCLCLVSRSYGCFEGTVQGYKKGILMKMDYLLPCRVSDNCIQTNDLSGLEIQEWFREKTTF